ncbi:hypothetical protein Syun_025987 [Stephania yunnanensis]|uniref:Uncharacterized protein n=1 Tax=Stephania yunnanensis TaxID=152371 RepID=A0AAP0EY30_9MAGN
MQDRAELGLSLLGFTTEDNLSGDGAVRPSQSSELELLYLELKNGNPNAKGPLSGESDTPHPPSPDLLLLLRRDVWCPAAAALRFPATAPLLPDQLPLLHAPIPRTFLLCSALPCRRSALLPAQSLVLLPPPNYLLCVSASSVAAPSLAAAAHSFLPPWSLSTELLPVYIDALELPCMLTGLLSRVPYTAYPCISTETDAENILCVGFGKAMWVPR